MKQVTVLIGIVVSSFAIRMAFAATNFKKSLMLIFAPRKGKYNSWIKLWFFFVLQKKYISWIIWSLFLFNKITMIHGLICDHFFTKGKCTSCWSWSSLWLFLNIISALQQKNIN